MSDCRAVVSIAVVPCAVVSLAVVSFAVVSIVWFHLPWFQLPRLPARGFPMTRLQLPWFSIAVVFNSRGFNSRGVNSRGFICHGVNSRGFICRDFAIFAAVSVALLCDCNVLCVVIGGGAV